MDRSPPTPDPAAAAPPRRWAGVFGLLGLLLLIVALGVGAWWTASEPVHSLRIGTGGAGGTYLPLGRGLAGVLERALPDRIDAEAIETAGSGDNAALLEAREVELAIVQNDTEVGDSVRAIAPLYPEVLHVVVRRGLSVEGLDDLEPDRVAAGPVGSGTHLLAARVLAHFGLGDRAEGLVHCSTADAVDRFEAGTLDAAFIVSGLKSSAVARLLGGEGRLLSLGDPAQVGSALDGLRVSHPFLARTVIPARTYGERPVDPVGTVAVQAVLVARADLDPHLVHDLTAALFDNRVALMKAHRTAAHLSEQFDPSSLQAPLHPGADQYYRRDAPPFWVEYAESMSLLFTVVLAVGSGLLGIRRWIRRTKKDRIDVYYVDIQQTMERWRRGEIDAPAAKEALDALRARAFAELVDERLSADQSFTIFQDYLTSELDKLETAAS